MSGLQVIERRRAEPIVPTKPGRWQPGLLVLEHADHLFVGAYAAPSGATVPLRTGELAFPHVVCAFRLGRLYITARELSGGGSPRCKRRRMFNRTAGPCQFPLRSSALGLVVHAGHLGRGVRETLHPPVKRVRADPQTAGNLPHRDLLHRVPLELAAVVARPHLERATSEPKSPLLCQIIQRRANFRRSSS